MSSKATILSTDDNEHWFFDCNEELGDYNSAITLEFNKANIRVDVNDSDCLIITITNPNCEIYKLLCLL